MMHLVCSTFAQAQDLEQKACDLFVAQIDAAAGSNSALMAHCDCWWPISKHPTQDLWGFYVDDRVRPAFTDAEWQLVQERTADWEAP